MLAILWFIFVGLVVIGALASIPYALWVKSDCIHFRLIDKEGNPIPNHTVYGAHEQTAYANTYAGNYGSTTVVTRSPIGTLGGTKKIGKTDADGIFKKRIIMTRFWGLVFYDGNEEVITFKHLFSQEKEFSAKPKDLTLDSSRTVADPRWFLEPGSQDYKDYMEGLKYMEQLQKIKSTHRKNKTT